jgi:hypothetical protein
MIYSTFTPYLYNSLIFLRKKIIGIEINKSFFKKNESYILSNNVFVESKWFEEQWYLPFSFDDNNSCENNMIL